MKRRDESDFRRQAGDLKARLVLRAADLKARFILLDLCEHLYSGPGNTSINEAVATLWHAMYYLEDRIGYEMSPAPKGMVLLQEQEKVELPPLDKDIRLSSEEFRNQQHFLRNRTGGTVSYQTDGPEGIYVMYLCNSIPSALVTKEQGITRIEVPRQDDVALREYLDEAGYVYRALAPVPEKGSQ